MQQAPNVHGDGSLYLMQFHALLSKTPSILPGKHPKELHAYHSHILQLFLSQGLGMGIAMGLIYSPSFSVISHHFRRRRSFAMGIVASGAAIGAIFQTIMLNYLFDSLGFANAIRANASLNACMLIVACFTIKCRPRMVEPEEEKRNKSCLNVLSFFREAGYMIVIAGFVSSPRTASWTNVYISGACSLISASSFLASRAQCTPHLYAQPSIAVYIQLFSFNKGFPRTFSFYSVSHKDAVHSQFH